LFIGCQLQSGAGLLASVPFNEKFEYAEAEQLCQLIVEH